MVAITLTLTLARLVASTCQPHPHWRTRRSAQHTSLQSSTRLLSSMMGGRSAPRPLPFIQRPCPPHNHQTSLCTRTSLCVLSPLRPSGPPCDPCMTTDFASAAHKSEAENLVNETRERHSCVSYSSSCMIDAALDPLATVPASVHVATPALVIIPPLAIALNAPELAVSRARNGRKDTQNEGQGAQGVISAAAPLGPCQGQVQG